MYLYQMDYFSTHFVLWLLICWKRSDVGGGGVTPNWIPPKFIGVPSLEEPVSSSHLCRYKLKLRTFPKLRENSLFDSLFKWSFTFCSDFLQFVNCTKNCKWLCEDSCYTPHQFQSSVFNVQGATHSFGSLFFDLWVGNREFCFSALAGEPYEGLIINCLTPFPRFCFCSCMCYFSS